jgi:hypothetical protein
LALYGGSGGLAILKIQDVEDYSNYVIFKVTGVTSNDSAASGWVTLTIENLVPIAVPFINAHACFLSFSLIGVSGPTGAVAPTGPTGPSTSNSYILQDGNMTTGNFNGYTSNAYFTNTQSWDFDNYEYVVLFEMKQTVSVGSTYLHMAWFDDLTETKYCYYYTEVLESAGGSGETNFPGIISLNAINSSTGSMEIYHYIKITFTRPKFSTNTILGQIEHSSIALDASGNPNRTYKTSATTAYSSSTNVTTGTLSSRLVFYNNTASTLAVTDQGYIKITRKPRGDS